MDGLKERLTLKQGVLYVVTGVIMGIANIIPGVSGGTMAVVTGIYDKIIAIFTLDWKFIRANWLFAVLVIAGILTGIFAFSPVIRWLLEELPIATNAFFVGVIAGTCPFIGKQARLGGGGILARVLPAVITFLVMAAMTVFQDDVEGGAARYVEHTALNMLIVGATMVLTAACMIIPGLSGSFVGLALGVYPSLIYALSEFDLLLLLPMAVGMVIGLVGGAKVIRRLLARFPTATYSAIFGLLIGSVLVLVYPLIDDVGLDFELVAAVVVLALGVVCARFFSREKA